MHALVSPTETAHSGQRIAQIEAAPFPVAHPFFWVECDDQVSPDRHYYNASTAQIDVIPGPTAPSQAQSIAATRKKAAELRLPIVNILSDLQIDALVDGDASLASTIKTLKAGLADVVNMDMSAYQTQAQMEDAVQAAYYALALGAPISLRAAFKSLVP